MTLVIASERVVDFYENQYGYYAIEGDLNATYFHAVP
jgi:hypothetical protein